MSHRAHSSTISQRHHITHQANISTFRNRITALSHRYAIIHRHITSTVHNSVTPISHQYNNTIKTISQQYHTDITSVSHRYHIGAPQADLFYMGRPRDATQCPTNTSRTQSRAMSRAKSRAMLNLSHTTSASLSEAHLIAYYLCEPPRAENIDHISQILLFIFFYI